MHDSQADFAAHYAAMGDPQLLELASRQEDLLEAARTALAAELEKRHLSTSEEIEYVEVVPQHLVTVQSYRDLSEASIARSVLESAGIQAFLSEENLVRMNWMLSNFLGGIRLQVAEEDLETAQEILAQPTPQNIQLENDESYSQPRCPQCGSLEVVHATRNTGLKLAGLYALHLPIPLPHDSLLCGSCGHKWEE